MTMPVEPERKFGKVRKSSRVKVHDENSHIADSSRRRALVFIAGQSIAIPAAYIIGRDLVGDPFVSTAKAASYDSKPRQSPIVRDFADPVVELQRLLREASEIEHALMAQYLYAAFSVKPSYEQLIGFGDPNAGDLLGVAIQEMQHLAQVNQLLVALGAAPSLLRQDFPYEPYIYPFAFNLEPLSRQSLAKYVYTEAPASALDRSAVGTKADVAFIDDLDEALGTNVRPNHVGSLYSAIIALSEEIAGSSDCSTPDLLPWIQILKRIQKEGEEDHFEFFKSVFLGTHAAFDGVSDV